MILLRARIILTCAVTYVWGSDWLAEKRWQDYAAEARLRGVHWTLSEYRPAPVPAHEDAALLPIFAQENAAGVLPEDRIPPLIREPRRLDGRLQLVDWKKTRKALGERPLVDDPAEPDDLRALDQAVRPFQSLVDELCQSKAIAGNWGDEMWLVSDGLHAPQLDTAQRCLRLLHFRANLDLAQQRPAEARRAVEAQIRLARVFRKTPNSLMHLLTLSGTSMARETVWRGLEIGAWDDDALRAFAGEFLAWNAIADYKWSLETDRAYVCEIIERLIDAPDKFMSILRVYTHAESMVNEWLLGIRVSRRSWWRNNQVWAERSRDELLSMLDSEAQVWRPIEREYDPNSLSENDREGELRMAAHTMSSAEPFMQKSVWMHAHNQMAAVACALELFRRATGHYPDTMDQLVPAYLPRIPVDPTTGRAFPYRVHANGTYLLYSVGFDREDHGGKVDLNSDRNPSDADWPWFVPSPQPRPSQGSPR